MNADQLITAVRKRSALWDPRHIGHNNRLLVNKLWGEVADEVGIDKNLAKSKWRGLRDYYRQEMRKQSNYTNDQGTEYRSSWALFDQMTFVKNTILPRRQRETLISISNAPDMDIDNNSEYYEEDPVNICIPKLEPQLDIPDYLPEHTRVSPIPLDFHDQEKNTILRRNSKSMLSDHYKNQEKYDSENLKRKIDHLERTIEESENDDLQFFKSLLPDLANLPRAKKSYIRLKIQEIIHKEVHNNEGIVKDDSC